MNGLDLLEALINDQKAEREKVSKVSDVPLFERLAAVAMENSVLWTVSGAHDHAKECREISQMLVSVGKMIDACRDKTLINDLNEVV